MTVKQARKGECKARLLEILKPGDTVYTILKHVSRSGMYRVIDLYVIEDNGPRRITGLAADLLGGYDKRHEGARAGGCGMDMGFHLVYNLGRVLFPNGVSCAGKGRCNSNDHRNPGPDRDKYNGQTHKDSGYAFRHSWM